MDITTVARQLNMQPHPEGGFFRETYRSDLLLAQTALPETFPGDRNASTAIYFLIGGNNFSAFHRIASDELWHYYAGSPLHVHEILPDGTYHLLKIGFDLMNGYEPQATVKAGSWFASECASSDSWSLVGCTVAPGFDFADFELANKEQLATAYPQHSTLIRRLCR